MAVYETNVSERTSTGKPRTKPLTVVELHNWLQAELQAHVLGLSRFSPDTRKVFLQCPLHIWSELNTKQPPYGESDIDELLRSLTKHRFELAVSEIYLHEELPYVDLTLTRTPKPKPELSKEPAPAEFTPKPKPELPKEVALVDRIWRWICNTQ
jgi:hypothetical protein